MKKLLLFLTISASAFGQGAQRATTALQPVPGGANYAQIIPSASVYVCTYNTNLTCTTGNETPIYSNVSLAGGSVITQPLIANNNGLYIYYAPLNTLVVEKVCAPYNQCTYTPILLGGGGTLTSVAPPAYAVQFASSPSANNLAADQYITITPSLDELSAPDLNGFLSASNPKYNTNGHNGIANAAASNTAIIVDPSYGNTEFPTPSTYATQSELAIEDDRNGNRVTFLNNPGISSYGLLYSGSYWGNDYFPAIAPICQYTIPYPATNGEAANSCFWITNISNVPGYSYGNPAVGPSGWALPSTLVLNSTIVGSGIAETLGVTQTKYGVGDNATGYLYTNGIGGTISASDQGTVTLAMNNQEVPYPYYGTCATGCTTGSTSVATTVSSQGSQGTGRYVIDTTQTPISTAITAITTGFGSSQITVASSSLPVSNAWGTLNSNVSPPINTSAPFKTAQTFNVTLVGGTGFDTTHPVCFNSQFHEQSIPTAAMNTSGSTWSLTVPVGKGHASGSYVFQGGMCGYGLEQTYKTSAESGYTLRYLLDVVGSTANNTIIATKFAYGAANLVPIFSQITNFSNLSNCSSSSNTVTCTYVSSGSTLFEPWLYNLGTYVLAGMSPTTALNGTCTNVVWTAHTSFTCTNSGSGTNPTASTGTASLGQQGINLWPIAESLDVRCSTLLVSGCLTLEPNIIAFASGDTMELTHPVAANFDVMQALNQVWNPYAITAGIGITLTGHGSSGGGTSGASASAVSINNSETDSYYIGEGGQAFPPNAFTYAGNYDLGLIFSDHGPSALGGVIYVQHSAAQDADPNYIDHFITGIGNSGTLQLNYVPNTNAVSLSGSGSLQISSGGPITYIGSSHTLTGPVTASSGLTVASAAPTAAAGQVSFGGTVVASSSCGSLSGAAGCLVINVAGTTHYVPYY